MKKEKILDNIKIYPSKYIIGQRVQSHKYEIKEAIIIGKRQHYKGTHCNPYDELEFECRDYDIIYKDNELGYIIDTYSGYHLSNLD